MTVSLDQYSASIAAKFPVIGEILWYSISDVRINEETLAAYMQEVGLSAHFLPPSIQGADAFRKSTKSAQRKLKHNGITENYLLREVSSDDSGILQHVVCEKVDSHGKKLSYDTLGEVRYVRPTDTHPHGKVVAFNNAPYYDEHLVDAVKDIQADIKNYFEDYAQYYHGTAIRSMVTRILKSYSTITVRSSGGVYFAPEVYRDEIAKVDRLFKKFGHGCQFHFLPLVDDSDQRKMLVAAFEDEAIVDIERTLDEVAEILKSGKTITSDRYDKLLGSYKEMKEKSKEYSDLLDEQMTRVGTSLTMLNAQIMPLLDRVKSTD